MRPLPAVDEEHRRWQALLEELAGIDDQLAAEYLEQIDGGARYYDSVPDEGDLKESARKAFRYLLARLRTRPLSAELIAFPAAVGALRARQGIALENLSAAVRNDFLVAWSALLRLADEADMAVLAMHVGQLWKVVDDFAGAVQWGYLDQRLQMARTDIIEQQQSLSDLFSDEPSPTLVHRAAEVLGLDESASYWVVGLGSEAATEAVTRRLSGLDVVALDHASKGVTLILLSAGHRWPDDEALAADLLSGVTGAVAPRAVQLQNVFRAAATVRTLAQLGAEAVTLRRSWPRLSISQLCTVIEDLRSYVDAPLAAMNDRDILVETLLVFADSGSVTTTAATMYCHRNTVLNRIRKFEEATGISLRTPRAQAMVQLCLLRS
ncbi:helix-turn-helix domain-containing protein [Mycobacterium sp. 21AC1]|uniref:helix-turn-helix domain-containing protein n=1 Tax=[Mycobacterium] appelbergii TaxID=2939269 RepID=UPI002938E0BA|nr:helix-turn-helix domain-containing protein [Mycobacterium sp. 21AC1]MDV3125415.1 helix-turn-helix domain-containing protein [Mycobacterium sp. 21AC1]